jgi:RND superfamily putative drug exporter
VIAATAVALNLLSVGAAYGILVAVFQHGWLAGVFGFQTNGAIVSWLPLFLFVVLFGLSMDYHVFILSRIKELHDAGASTDDAIRLAITRTAGTVTSAAIIMVAVFGLFATLSMIMMQQMGFGLAVAVLIDATVIRAVLVPAAMKLLGEWNWYLPTWLQWLPSLSPEALSPEAERSPEEKPTPKPPGRALPTT